MKTYLHLTSIFAAGLLLTACNLSNRFVVVPAEGGAEDVPGPENDVPEMDGPLVCAPTETACNGVCVDTATSVSNCGMCGMNCAVPNDGTTSCNAGQCAPKCPELYQLETMGAISFCRRKVGRQIAPLSGSTIEGDSVVFEVGQIPNGVNSTITLSTDPSFVMAGQMQTMPIMNVMNGVARVRIDNISTLPNLTNMMGACRNANSPGLLRTLFWRLNTPEVSSKIWTLYLTCESRAVAMSPMVAAIRTRRASSSWGVNSDFNGDGQEDPVVGMPGHGMTGAFTVGVINMDSFTFSAPIVPPMPDAEFGRQVVAIGDINGDGRSDLAVNGVGDRVYIYYGSASATLIDPAAVQVLTNAEPSIGFGARVFPLGDVDHDGFSDIAVTASAYEDGATMNVGKVFIYFGGLNGLDTRTPASLVPNAAGMPAMSAEFGTAIAGACDYNSDGIHDFAIGAPGENKIYLYLGGEGRRAFSDPRVFAPANETSFGRTIACIGDMTRDGVVDFAVGTKAMNGARQIVFYPGILPGMAIGTLARAPAPILAIPGAGVLQQLRGGLDAYGRFNNMIDARRGELELLAITEPSAPGADSIFTFQNQGVEGSPTYADPAITTRFPGVTTSMMNGQGIGFIRGRDGSVVMLVGDPGAADVGSGAMNAGVVRGFGVNPETGVTTVAGDFRTIAFTTPAANARFGAALGN